MNLHWIFLATVLLAGGARCQNAATLPVVRAADAPPPGRIEGTDFIRYHKGEKVGRLETAAVTYENLDTGQTVTLLAVVHIGDKSYFADLQKRLADFDVVLYEGVKKGEKDVSDELTWITRMQVALKDYLGLEYQKDRIDYTAKNLLHADMSMDEVDALLEERGVGLLPYSEALSNMGPIVEMGLKLMKKLGGDSDSPQFRVVRQKMKTTMATVLGNGLSVYDKFKRQDDKLRDEVIIEARNAVVATKLAETLKGKTSKKIAVLYGAAHMPDLEKRLLDDLQLRKSKVEWVPAWTIQMDGSEAVEEPQDPAEGNTSGSDSRPTSAPASRPVERRRKI